MTNDDLKNYLAGIVDSLDDCDITLSNEELVKLIKRIREKVPATHIKSIPTPMMPEPSDYNNIPPVTAPFNPYNPMVPMWDQNVVQPYDPLRIIC